MCTAFEIRPLDVLLWLPKHKLYIWPHAQEDLVGLDSEWEEHLTWLVLGVQGALRVGGALPCFRQRRWRHREGKLRHRRATHGYWDKWSPKMLLVKPRRIPRSSEAGMIRQRDARELPLT